MEGSNLMQEMYAIGKRLEELKIFHRARPFNNTEMQMMREIIAAKERGSRVISSGLAKLLGITRSAVSQMVKKLESKGVVRRVPDSRRQKDRLYRAFRKGSARSTKSRARGSTAFWKGSSRNWAKRRWSISSPARTNL